MVQISRLARLLVELSDILKGFSNAVLNHLLLCLPQPSKLLGEEQEDFLQPLVVV